MAPSETETGGALPPHGPCSLGVREVELLRWRQFSEWFGGGVRAIFQPMRMKAWAWLEIPSKEFSCRESLYAKEAFFSRVEGLVEEPLSPTEISNKGCIYALLCPDWVAVCVLKLTSAPQLRLRQEVVGDNVSSSSRLPGFLAMTFDLVWIW